MKNIIKHILITLLFVIELDYAIESPGGLMDLKDKVNVENSYEENGIICHCICAKFTHVVDYEFI